MAEIEGALCPINDDRPQLLICTDDGPDHPLTYATV